MICGYLFEVLQIVIFQFFIGSGGYKIVEKKVPEFIVPDLTGFEVWLCSRYGRKMVRPLK